jgi:hypothetical protein
MKAGHSNPFVETIHSRRFSVDETAASSEDETAASSEDENNLTRRFSFRASNGPVRRTKQFSPALQRWVDRDELTARRAKTSQRSVSMQKSS